MSKSSIFSAGLFLFFLIGISKIIAFFKDIVLSSYFGANYQTDAYFVANSIPSLIFIAFYSTVSLVFLPIFNEKLKIDGPSVATAFASNVINIYAIISLCLSLLGVFFSSFLVSVVAPAFNEQTADLASQLTKILCLSFVFSITSGILSSIQNVFKRYSGPQFIPIVNNSLIILAIVLFSQAYGIYVVAIAGVIGWVLQVPIQKLFAGSRFKYKPIFRVKDRDLRKMSMLVIPAFIAISIDQVNVLIDNILGSPLEEGSLSALNYGMRLMNFFSGLFIVIITSILYPEYSDHILNDDTKALNDSINSSLRTFLLIAAPITLISFFYNYEIVSLVFKRGAFNEYAAIKTSQVFMFYSLGIAFILIREILNKVFYAFQKPKIPLYISIVSILINLICSIYFVKFLGVGGLALATSISIIAYVIIQLFFIRRKIGAEFGKNMEKFIPVLLISLVLMSCTIFLIQNAELTSLPILKLLIGLLIGGFTYLISLYLFKIKELGILYLLARTHLSKVLNRSKS